MANPRVKLIRKHRAGVLVIQDRKKVGDKYEPVRHGLKPGAFNKTFPVFDIEYVMTMHSAILKRVGNGA